MTSDPDAVVRELAEEQIGEPIVAAAFFRVRWDGEMSGFGSGMVLVLTGVLLTLAGWLIPRIRSKLPSNSYVAVTASDVCVLEFVFGPPRVQRMVSRWPRRQVGANAAGENLYSVDIIVEGRTVELEALKYDADSAGVVDALVGR